MDGSEEMTTIGKWNLSTATDWELSDHSEIIVENIQQSKLVTESCKQLMTSWMNRNSINFFGKILPELDCIGAIVPDTNSSIIWWSSNQWFSDSTRKTCNRSRMKSTSQIIKGTFTGFIIETRTWVVYPIFENDHAKVEIFGLGSRRLNWKFRENFFEVESRNSVTFKLYFWP